MKKLAFLTFCLISFAVAYGAPETVDSGITTKTTVIATTATNAITAVYTNAGSYARMLSQITLSYKAADSSTVTVSIADSYGSKLDLMTITNSATTHKMCIPDSNYYIMNGSSLWVSNSPITANTNKIQILVEETFVK